MLRKDDQEKLVRILRHAYSGERAAALAYRGHWRSLPQGDDRTRIQEIEREEWHHRDLVGGMLIALKARPSGWGEARAAIVGGALGPLCHVTGWLVPMYAAGRLESANVQEYERAAELAVTCGHAELVEGLLEMAEVEWEHERYFRSRVESHAFSRWIPIWTQPPPKAEIRASFARSQSGGDRTTAAARSMAPAVSKAYRAVTSPMR